MATLPTQQGQHASNAPLELSGLEVEVIDLFVNAVRLLGIPKSVGEIYGVLFISPKSLALDQLVDKLQISKGSASQGIKFLRSVGAVKPVYVAGERRDYYEAVAELKPLASGFIKKELMPHLENGVFRLERLQKLAQNGGEGSENEDDADFYQGRVERLEQWHNSANEILPFLKKFLG